jgi:hypothetical protein
MSMMPIATLSDLTNLFHSLMNMDKDTLHTLAYATYLYIMMDRFNHKPARSRARR